MRPRAILARLLLVLALALFSVPQGHADGAVTHGGPAAQSQVEQAQGILTVQGRPLRAQPPDDPAPDAAMPVAATEARRPNLAAAMSPAPYPPLSPLAIRILPPVRGPPAA